ncbi:hypothetical protein [Paenibacillus sp. OV219]|uniref:hypothetical protein n=1 Tax=Paenibacillus sp. OV219 TaxID=1884377 RepID=UPI0011601F13|nr:hypothetical protein [Paenibacillus sp. OV219]
MLLKIRWLRLLLSGLLHAGCGYFGIWLLLGIHLRFFGEIGLYSALVYYLIDVVLASQLRKNTVLQAVNSFLFGPLILFMISIVLINR